MFLKPWVLIPILMNYFIEMILCWIQTLLSENLMPVKLFVCSVWSKQLLSHLIFCLPVPTSLHCHFPLQWLTFKRWQFGHKRCCCCSVLTLKSPKLFPSSAAAAVYPSQLGNTAVSALPGPTPHQTCSRCLTMLYNPWRRLRAPSHCRKCFHTFLAYLGDLNQRDVLLAKIHKTDKVETNCSCKFTVFLLN